MPFTTNIQISKSMPCAPYDATETSDVSHEDHESDGTQYCSANATFVQTNRVASHNAVDEVWGAAGGTIYVPPVALDVVGAIYVEISTAAFATGTLRISGEGSVPLVQSVRRNLFVIAGATGNRSAIQAQSERLAFGGGFQRRLSEHDRSAIPRRPKQKKRKVFAPQKSQSEERIVE